MTGGDRSLATLLLLLVLAACPSSSSTKIPCTDDSECGSAVCARTDECLAPSDVYFVKLTWTIRGSAANASSCGRSPSFFVQFDGPEQSDTFGYEPVPCDPGQFTVDKLPRRYTQAEISDSYQFLEAEPITADGSASFDLYP